MSGANRPGREDLPRITVDSISDWRRIQASYTTSAIKKLDEQLAANGLSHEREAHLAHLNSFISETFKYARMNMRVNGRNLEDMDEDEEATLDSYDESLDRRVWTLYNQRLEWNKVVAQKRREIPMDAEALMTDVLGRQRAADNDTTIYLAQNVVQPLPDIATQGAVSEQARHVLDNTIALSGSMAHELDTETERAHRARTVIQDLELNA